MNRRIVKSWVHRRLVARYPNNYIRPCGHRWGRPMSDPTDMVNSRAYVRVRLRATASTTA